MKMVQILGLPAVLSLFALGGCAAFPQHQVPMLAQLPDASKLTHKPSLEVSLRVYDDVPPDLDSPYDTARITETVRKTLVASGLFNRIVFSDDPTASDMKMNLKIYDETDKTAGFMAGNITIVTLGIVPTWSNDTLRVAVTLFDKSGKQSFSHESRDTVTSRYGLIYLPWTANAPDAAEGDMLGNQINVALKEAYDSGLFVISDTGAPLSAAPATASAP